MGYDDRRQIWDWLVVSGEQSVNERALTGQKVLCLIWGFISPWRQPQEEVTSSLDQSMSHDAFLDVFTDTASENNLWASSES